MHIEHVALYVDDLEKAKDFFIKFFNAASNNGYLNEKTRFRSFFLTFDNGTRLEIVHRPDMNKNEKVTLVTGYNHIAFSVGDEQAVDELTEKLEQEGYPVVSGPRRTGDGYYESCIVGFEGILIEITV